MSPLLFLVACLAGGLGAATRFLVDVGVRRVLGDRFPWGIVIVNITGCWGLGLLAGLLPEGNFVWGAGFLGGYTTFSTAMLDSLDLWRRGQRGVATGHAVGTLLLTVIAALAGLALGGVLR